MATRSAWNPLVVGCILVALQFASNASYAVDSTSLEFGSGNQTQIARISMQWLWQKRWWQSNGHHIGGYWDLALAQWREKRFQDVEGKSQNLTAIGFTPVFRLQGDSLRGPYGELAIGIHYLSDLYDNNGRQLSTRFEFGDRIGLGYVFDNKLDLAVLFEHFSNGGAKEPNDGVNFTIVRMRYLF